MSHEPTSISISKSIPPNCDPAISWLTVGDVSLVYTIEHIDLAIPLIAIVRSTALLEWFLDWLAEVLVQRRPENGPCIDSPELR